LNDLDYRYLRIAVLWNDTLTTETVIRRGKSATVGEKKADLLVPETAGLGNKFPMFVKGDGCSALNLEGIGPHVSGKLHLNGREISVEEARKTIGHKVNIGSGDWGVIDLGPCAIYFQALGHDDRLPPGGFIRNLESSILTALLFAVTLHLGFLIAAFVLWTDDPTFAEIDLSDRFMKVIVEEPKAEIELEEEEEEEETIEEDVGKKAGGEEGKFGEEDKIEKSKVPKRDGELVDKVKDVGIHKALGSDILGRGPMQNVFGDKTGFDSKLNAAMSGSDGSLNVGNGTGGMGLRGTGSGGGGQGFGRIHGMGRIDTGGGRGVRARLGGKAKRKKRARVRVRGGGFSGFCKQKDILRVVNRRKGGIQFCYEKELARNPSLSGKVTMGWAIGLDGKAFRVVVQGSTLRSKTVEGCMRRNISRWRFPKPEGGMCQVRFPFVFSGGL
jgi:hypothetical protein